jgi:hypothetical protein
LESGLKEMGKDELNSYWSRENRGSKQGFIYLDELKESTVPSHIVTSDLVLSPRLPQLSSFPILLLHKQTDKMRGCCKMIRMIPMSRRITKTAKEIAR